MSSPPDRKPAGLGAVLDVTVEKLVPGGDGLARADGQVLFIPFALPGEKVRVRVTEAKRDFARAEILEFERASPDRVEPPCPAFGRCGGCDWQHIASDAQARHKAALAEDALRRIGGIDLPGLAVETGKPWRYRNRIQLHRDARGGAGFLARGSHALAAVADCPVAAPGFAPLFRRAESDPVPETDDRRHRLPAEPGRPPRDGRDHPPGRYAAWSHPLPGGGDFLMASTPESGRAGRGSGNGGGDGHGEIAVDILGKTFRFDLRCFFQSNLEMTGRLVPWALDGLAGGLALDLYCGVGLFGAFLADRFPRVMAVEENAHSLAYARRNIGGTHAFLRGRVEDLLRDAGGPLARARPDAVVVDPPRSGLDRAVSAYLAAARPPRLVYVSCNPVTLARDLKFLRGEGFALDDVRLFDFYPQTAHIEAVARLSRRG